MLCCAECGTTFEVPVLLSLNRDVDACPNCYGGDIEEMQQCVGCGEYVVETCGDTGLCEKCAYSALEDIKEYVKRDLGEDDLKILKWGLDE